MSQKLHNFPASQLPNALSPTVVAQIGNKNTQVAHANQVITNTNVFMMNSISGNGQNGFVAQLQSYLTVRSSEYYNLFVINGETFDNGRFLVAPDRALTESIDEELKRQLASLTDEAKVRIKTFPSLFMSELNRADQEQVAYYGFITDITIQGKDIRIEFQKLSPLPQNKLNEIHRELALEGKRNINELDRTHWTIKQVDLLNELKIAGLDFFGAT